MVNKLQTSGGGTYPSPQQTRATFHWKDILYLPRNEMDTPSAHNLPNANYNTTKNAWKSVQRMVSLLGPTRRFSLQVQQEHEISPMWIFNGCMMQTVGVLPVHVITLLRPITHSPTKVAMKTQNVLSSTHTSRSNTLGKQSKENENYSTPRTGIIFVVIKFKEIFLTYFHVRVHLA